MGTVGMDERFVDAGGRRVAVCDWGGEGPTIIFVHGGGDNAATWTGIAPLVAVGRLVAYDIVGHGRSDAPTGFHHRDLDDDIDAVIEWAGPAEPPFLVGQSLGTAIGVWAAHRRPLAGMLLLDGGPGEGHWGPMEFLPEEERRKRMVAAGFGWVGDEAELEKRRALRLQHVHPNGRAAAAAAFARSHPRRADGRWEVRPPMELLIPMGGIDPMTHYGRPFAELWLDVPVPTIALMTSRGASGAIRDRIDAAVEARANPMLEASWVDTGHSIHWDRPDLVVDGITRMIGRAA